MFLIKDKTNNFSSKNLIDLLLQNNANIIASTSKNYFSSIELSFEENGIILTFEKRQFILKNPISFNDFHDKLLLIISDYKVSFQEFEYFPLQQKVHNKNNTKKLTYTHAIILNNLILNQDGINKSDLYKIIWPADKEMSLNKLDTHLTNLKNIFVKDLKCSLNYFSKNGLLKLLIN
tara:strand:+ start:1139 stop:1669 length:531 start_codon:yes stop_codon:yes gene_type:complete